MNKMMRRNLWREVCHSPSRFLAIFAIVALGVGFLAGLMATTPDMRLSVDRYYDETQMMDVRVLSTLGLTDEDVEAVRAMTDVETVMPAYAKDVLMSTPSDDTAVARLQSLPTEEDAPYLNRLILTEGRLPQQAGECVVESERMIAAKLSIGDTVHLAPDNGDLSDTLAVREFTVVGCVKSAYYFSVEQEPSTVGKGSVDLFLYTPASSFSLEVYTDLFVTVKGAAALTAFSDAYDDAVEPVTKQLEALGKVQAPQRRTEVVAEATDKLEEARREYDEGKQTADEELAAAKKKLDDARAELEKQEKRLADGKKQLAAGEQALNEARETLEARRSEAAQTFAQKDADMADSRTQLDEWHAQLETAAQQLDEGKQALIALEERAVTLEIAGHRQEAAAIRETLAEQTAAWQKQQAALTAQLQQYAAKDAAWQAGAEQLEAARLTAQTELEAAQTQLEEKTVQLASLRRTITNGEKALTEGKKDLAQGETAYADSKTEADKKLADGKRKLEDAEQAIADIDQAEWYVLDRHTNVGYVSFEGNAQKVEAIARVFPLFFFLVAALVALTTMTRMVEEQRTQIGTLKALGYHKGAIVCSYLLYAGVATLSGSVFGLVVGFKVLPTVIWGAYDIMYTLPPLFTPFNVPYALIASLAALACTMLATLGACYSTLAACPARLMLPRAPKAGKRVLLERIPLLWKHLSFTKKVTVRNLIRYKKRFFMTVFGIAGCTALLVTGFGLRDSIRDIIGLQFGEIVKYNLTVEFREEAALQDPVVQTQLAGDSSSWLPVHQSAADVTADGKSKSTTLYVPAQRERLGEFITLRERITKKAVPFEEGKVVMTEKLAAQMGVKTGSTVTLKNADGKTAQVTVGGICENYVYSYIYMPPALYTQAFGAPPEYLNVAASIADDSKANRDAVTTALLQVDTVRSVHFTTDLRYSFSDIIQNIDYIVMVLIVSAGLLAFVVLYNLTNINITEREKEIATIKVLGFYDREVSAYIYRETAILTLIGTAAGLVLGIFLHAFVVQTAEVDIVMFGRTIKGMSYLLSAVLTLVFALLVNVVMYFKLKKIDMVESMKAGE